jgi:hypothetical protein
MILRFVRLELVIFKKNKVYTSKLHKIYIVNTCSVCHSERILILYSHRIWCMVLQSCENPCGFIYYICFRRWFFRGTWLPRSRPMHAFVTSIIQRIDILGWLYKISLISLSGRVWILILLEKNVTYPCLINNSAELITHLQKLKPMIHYWRSNDREHHQFVESSTVMTAFSQGNGNESFQMTL